VSNIAVEHLVTAGLVEKGVLLSPIHKYEVPVRSLCWYYAASVRTNTFSTFYFLARRVVTSLSLVLLEAEFVMKGILKPPSQVMSAELGGY